MSERRHDAIFAVLLFAGLLVAMRLMVWAITSVATWCAMLFCVACA